MTYLTEEELEEMNATASAREKLLIENLRCLWVEYADNVHLLQMATKLYQAHGIDVAQG